MPSNDMLQQPVAQAIAWALLQFVWQGALIAVLTAALLFALRRGAADVRYVVSTIALSLMLTMPVVTTVQTLGSLRSPAAAPGQGSHALALVPPANGDRLTLETHEAAPARPTS